MPSAAASGARSELMPGANPAGHGDHRERPGAGSPVSRSGRHLAQIVGGEAGLTAAEVVVRALALAARRSGSSTSLLSDGALKKKDAYVKRYGRAGSEKGFHFLTGDEGSIQALTGALGFRYTYDPASKQFAHASGLMIATPDGRISRYLYGVDYAPRDLRLALVEAAQRKIGSPIDELLLFCYHYDPATGKYGAVAMNFLRLAAAATVLGIGVFLTILIRRTN